MNKLNIKIQPVTQEDVKSFYQAFVKLVRTQFPEYTERIRKYLCTNERAINLDVLKNMINKNDIVLAAYNNDKIVGLLIGIRQFGGMSLCHWLAVDPSFQRMGIGKQLLLTWEKLSKARGAHALRLESDKRNIPFYEKCGFKEVGHEEKGYFGTNNYILMKRIQEPKEENFLK